MGDILLQLQAEIVTRGAGSGAIAAAEPAALVADGGFDGGKELGGSHQADGDAGAAEDGLDDFAVVVAGDDDAVLDGVAADDAAGGDAQAEDRVAGGGELVDQLAGGGAAVKEAWIGVFQDDHAAALKAGVGGVDGGGDEIGEIHVSDEAAALLDLEDGLAIAPFGDADLAAEEAGFDTGVGEGFGEAKGSAPAIAGGAAHI